MLETKEDFPRLHVFGPMRLMSSQGTNCTPKGGHRKALLALLVLSPGGVRGRSYLEAMLWPEKTEKQASSGLRNALSLLRKELRQGLGFDPITADTQSISLDLDALWVDIASEDYLAKTFAHGSAPDVLEGLNLRGRGFEEFEDWLRDARAHGQEIIAGLQGTYATSGPKPAQSMPVPEAITPDLPPHFRRDGVGLLPPMIAAGDIVASTIADKVLGAIAADLVSLGNVRIYDYRDGAPGTSGPGPKLLLRAKVLTDPTQFALQLSVLRIQTNEMVGSNAVSGAMSGETEIDGVVLGGFVGQAVDRILGWLSGPGNSAAPASAYQALHQMFSYEHGALDATGALLSDAFEESSDATFLALLAYLETFHVGEHWGVYDADVLERTRSLTSQALRSNQHNAMMLGAAGHAVGYTLHDLDAGGALLQEAVERNPTLAFLRDHLALNYVYRGDYETAKCAAYDALRVGAYSPLKFTYDATLCMASALSGDDMRAVHFGQKALAHRPDFGAPLRYTAISLAHLGRRDEAEAMIGRIKKMDPTFSKDWVHQGRLALLDDDAKSRVITGLELAGVTD